MRSLVVLVSAAALVVSIYAFSDPIASPDKGAEAVSKVEEMRHEMQMEIQAFKDHVFQLGNLLTCRMIINLQKIREIYTGNDLVVDI